MPFRVGVVWTALWTGILSGLVLEIATFLLARYGPSGVGEGGSWSFRGNGALVVPFGLGPTVLAGGWVAIVLHFRGTAAWLRMGVAAALIGALIAVVGALSIAFVGSASGAVSLVSILLVWAWMLVAPVLAGLLPVTHRTDRRALLPHIAAIVLFAAAMVGGFALTQIVLPPGS